MSKEDFVGSWDNISVNDIAQAAYLIKHGYIPVEMVPVDNNHSQFIFANNPVVVKLLLEWKYSGERSYYIHYRELLREAFKLQREEFGGER